MPPDRLIRGRKVENDVWQVFGLAPFDDIAKPLPDGPVLVPLAYWKAHRAALATRGAPFGVWLAPEDDPAELADDLAHFALVAVHFPKYGDGRGYSTATLLRARYGYTGELRAFGDIGRDHLFQLARCGFDAFKLAPHRDPEAALVAFNDFTVRYQGAADDPVPLFRRRTAGIGRMS